ncbi:type II toxin-antitoxin system Phd/YefM family antitoxin [Jiangella gansuensis]|uniref:type II toxin-antitoxin system Phd/YefM family antitoxin n=1 Tax=Jiangella gansuensis TaxID=281473 RepID=UPI00047C3173|nr:type II toxin-antitoxin system prevent-host-death family antitoxin [Jiangella gansuensis]
MTRTISHRELRNLSGEVLREVKAGEVIEVTNRGEPVAVLMPVSGSAYERLVAAGKVRLAEQGRSVDLTQLPRRRSSESTADIIADLRGDR